VAKGTFASGTFRARTFASGTWAGGTPPNPYTRAVGLTGRNDSAQQFIGKDSTKPGLTAEDQTDVELRGD
jgi:hypothetical protein